MNSGPPKWLIDNVAEASINARKLFFIYIGFISYCALTIVSTTDRQLVIGGNVKLPVINVEVGLTGFFIIAPAIAIILFVYFQLYLRRLEALKAKLRDDCPKMDKMRLYPWMINMVEAPEAGFGGWLQRRFVSFSLWWSLPLLLVLFALWFLKKNEPILSYFVGALPVIGALLALYFRHINEERVNNTPSWSQWVDIKIMYALYSRLFNKDQVNETISEVEQVMLWSGRYSLLIYLIIFELVFIFYWTPSALKGELPKFTVDLSYQKLITEPKKDQDYKELYWGNFNGLNLRGANLKSVVLKRADLRAANLKWANLLEANLYSADLEGANLEGANLGRADLQEASLGVANLKGANLWGANLQKASLLWANLEKADLREANLQGTDLQGADLFGANLEKADLAGANLAKANLRGADLEGVKNLTVEQLSRVKTLYGVKNLEPKLMEAIKKDYPHLLEEPKEEPKD